MKKMTHSITCELQVFEQDQDQPQEGHIMEHDDEEVEEEEEENDPLLQSKNDDR